MNAKVILIFILSLDLPCQTNIKKSFFSENQAQHAGGAIHWNDLQPVVDNTTKFQNNKVSKEIVKMIQAELYRNDYSSFPKSIRVLQNSKERNLIMTENISKIEI